MNEGHGKEDTPGEAVHEAQGELAAPAVLGVGGDQTEIDNEKEYDYQGYLKAHQSVHLASLLVTMGVGVGCLCHMNLSLFNNYNQY